MLKFHIGPTLNFQAVRPFCEKHTGSWWKQTCLQSSTAPKFLSFKEKDFKWEAVIINIKNMFWWLQTAERRIKWKSFLKIKCSGMKLSQQSTAVVMNPNQRLGYVSDTGDIKLLPKAYSSPGLNWSRCSSEVHGSLIFPRILRICSDFPAYSLYCYY